jgi:hypothetical protein
VSRLVRPSSILPLPLIDQTPPLETPKLVRRLERCFE